MSPQAGLHGSEDWWDRILAEITERPNFLVVLSPNANASVWVPREMKIAHRQHVELGKRLLPVRLAESERREDWKDIQEFDFTQPDDPARYDAALAAVLRAILDGHTTPAPARPLSPNERLAKETHTAYGREHWSDVVDKTDILIERGAMTPALWRERASAAFALGDNRAGLEIIKQALKAGTDDTDTLLLYVRLTTRAGDDAQAAEILTRAFALAPLDDSATRLVILDALTAALARLGRWDDFSRRLSDARRMEPGDPRWALREVEGMLGAGRYDEAIAAARKLPPEAEKTLLTPSWHAAIAAAVKAQNWPARRALLVAAPAAGADRATIFRWGRFDFASFSVIATSTATGTSCVAWRGRPMARGWPRQRAGAAGDAARPSGDVTVGMGARWGAAGHRQRRRRGCGRWRAGGCLPPSSTTATTAAACLAWRGRPMGSGWPPPTTIRRRSSGARSSGRRSKGPANEFAPQGPYGHNVRLRGRVPGANSFAGLPHRPPPRHLRAARFTLPAAASRRGSTPSGALLALTPESPDAAASAASRWPPPPAAGS